MADIRPFQGIRYNEQLGVDLGQLLSPPYDVISPALQQKLYETNPYNIVRLELGKDTDTDSATDNKYSRASTLLNSWIANGIMVNERQPAYYLIEEEFLHLGTPRKRYSLLARVKLEEFSSGIIIPHEETSPGPKADRLNLLTATKANMSPIMSLYRSQSTHIRHVINTTASERPSSQVSYSENNIKLWVINQQDRIDTIRDSLRDTPIYLADGHHRYETALRYRDTKDPGMSPEGDHNFVMMSLLDIEDPGLIVLPYHRMLQGISIGIQERILERFHEFFDVLDQSDRPEEIHGLVNSFQSDPDKSASQQMNFGIMTHPGPSFQVATLKKSFIPSSPLEKCHSWFLSQTILEPILGSQETLVEKGQLIFTHEATEVLENVGNGSCQLGLLLPPVNLDVFEQVIKSGKRMPIKSTYFSPKLPTGLVLNKVE